MPTCVSVHQAYLFPHQRQQQGAGALHGNGNCDSLSVSRTPHRPAHACITRQQIHRHASSEAIEPLPVGLCYGIQKVDGLPDHVHPDEAGGGLLVVRSLSKLRLGFIQKLHGGIWIQTCRRKLGARLEQHYRFLLTFHADVCGRI